MAIAFYIVALIFLLLVFVIATDGRYFGKFISTWIYERLGPGIFSLQSEADTWRVLASELDLKGDERILDVGSAVGDLPLTLASLAGFQGFAVGVDLSASMLARATGEAGKRGLRGKTAFTVADASATLPFLRNAFDVVVCMGLLETIRRPEDGLKELTRVLAPGGALVVSVYRGLSSLVASMDEGWYLSQLGERAGEHHRLLHIRKSHDILIVLVAKP
jgi:ubiquinone/menaquinone biosynthesis C-methylase UbiE